jgi:pyruvate/2-oxoglutarate dehydrogenase complex dihydrolipoamide dehydrogenase (E3) component
MVLVQFFDAKYGEWLGCHMIWQKVTDMIEAVHQN